MPCAGIPGRTGPLENERPVGVAWRGWDEARGEISGILSAGGPASPWRWPACTVALLRLPLPPAGVARLRPGLFMLLLRAVERP